MTISIKEKREYLADRLKECLEYAGMKPATLIRETEYIYGVSIHSSYLTMILKADRTLPSDYAEYFSSILGVDYGYLIGSDKFTANSYEEYLQQMENKEQFKDEIREIKKYDNYLDPCGYYVVGGSGTGGNVTKYQIERKRKVIDAPNLALIPADKMEAFKRDVDTYIKHKMDALMMEHEIDP